MQIPISKPLFSYHNLNLLTGDKVTLAFESGEIDRSELEDHNNGSGPSTGKGGGGGRGGGGKGGGRGSSNSGGRTPGFEKIDFEINVKLAQNPNSN